MKTITANYQQEADFLLKLKIAFLKKEGYLDGPKTGIIKWERDDETSAIGIESHVDEYHPYLRLLYSQGDSKGNRHPLDYKVHLHRTPCNYGGWRFWFLCPLGTKRGLPCGKISAVLYKGGDYFGCRKCYNLTYWCRKHNTNYSLNFWMRSKKLICQIDKLEQEVKKSEYAGKPTRNQKRLDKVYDQVMVSLRKFDQNRILPVDK